MDIVTSETMVWFFKTFVEDNGLGSTYKEGGLESIVAKYPVFAQKTKQEQVQVVDLVLSLMQNCYGLGMYSSQHESSVFEANVR